MFSLSFVNCSLSSNSGTHLQRDVKGLTDTKYKALLFTGKYSWDNTVSWPWYLQCQKRNLDEIKANIKEHQIHGILYSSSINSVIYCRLVSLGC